MLTKLSDPINPSRDLADHARGWVMVGLTAAFVILYSLALLGWIKPLTDERMVSRLEPIIFVIIGYYFGRLPAQQNEKTLKDEVYRQTQKADAAQHAKEQILEGREALEEKVKNVRAALATSAAAASRFAEGHERAGGSAREDALRQSIAAALSILNP